MEQAAICLCRSPFNSRPHKEVDLFFLWKTYKKVDFQFTTSQGGRRSTIITVTLSVIFQFTTSQGGRLFENQYSDEMSCSFNSRPHKEVDNVINVNQVMICSFNSRPHKEVDELDKLLIDLQISLSIHDLTRRSTLLAYLSISQ